MCLRVKTHPVCPTAAAAARHPSVLLILVTGIPASGKSTFLAAAQHYVLQPDGTLGTVPLFGGRSRGRIHSVLQLDEVLEDLSAAATQTTDPATSAGKRKFNPLLWKRATRRLLELTQSTLHACIEETAGCDETAHVVVPIVFVEDNMHYRSMRERYYQLCRTLEGKAYSLPSLHDASITAAESQQPFIPLFELRFSTPLDVCLARNAQRDQSWDASNGEKANAPAWVPPPVICSMDALFDHCCVATGVVDHGARNACEVEGWQWTATTQPWGLVVHATRGVTLDKNCPGTLAETAAGFFEVALQQPEAWDECQRQYQDVLRARLLRLREDEPLNENACLLRTAKAVETPHTHKLDLQLRSVVHAFLCQQTHQNACDNDDESSTRQRTAVFRKSLAAAKREAAQRFKVQIRQLSTTGNNVMDNAAVDVLSRSIDDIQESVIQQFQQTVLGLWEELEGSTSRIRIASSEAMQSLLEELLRYRAALTVQEELGRLCKAHLPSSSSSHARGLLPSAIFEGHQSLAVTTSNPPGVRDTECVQRTRRWVHPIIDVRRQAEVVEVPEVMPIGAGRLRLVAMQYDQGDIRGVVEPLETTDDAAATTSAQLQRSVSIKNLRLAIPEPFYHDALLPALEAIEPHHASKNVLDLCLNKLCGAANKMDTSFNQKRKRAWQLTDEVTYIFYVARKQLAQRREAVQMQKYNGGEERPWELKVYLESGDARLLGVLESAPPSGGIGGSGRTAIVIDLVRGVESSSEWVRLRDWLVPSASSCSDTVPCQEQYDVEWTVLSDAALRFRIPIGADVVLRLHARYTAQRPVAAPTTTKLLFLHALARLLLRYHGLSGGRMEKESGWQAAVPPSVIDVFEHHHQGLLSTQRPTVIAECFSSPFNATRSFFFSVFHDTDADFGSLGNFFGCCDAAACIAAVNAAERSSCGAVEDVASPARCPTSGGGGSGGGDVSTTASVSNSHHLLRLECNPPFDHEVIAAAFSHLLKWLENASLTIAVSILIIIPDSKQVHAAQVRATIEQSRFCRWVRSLPPRECLYVHGAHYQDPSASDGPIAHLKFRKRPRETVSEATNSSCLAAVANSLVRLSCPSRLMVIQDDKAEQACPGSEIGAEVVAAWSQLSNRVYSSAR